MNKTTLALMHSIAESRGGECFETSASDPLKMRFWSCGPNHTYMTKPGKGSKGTSKTRWCIKCSQSSLGIQSDELQREVDEMNVDRDRSQKKLIEFACANAHPLRLSVSDVLQGVWCKGCIQPQGESMAISILNHSENTVFEKTRPTWLTYAKVPLELDGFSESMGIAIEYDGDQHHRHIPHFHREPGDFERQQARDRFKNQKCADQKILLMRIPEIVKKDRESMTSHVIAIAIETAMPLAVNPDFLAMLDEHGIKLPENRSQALLRPKVMPKNMVIGRSLESLLDFVRVHGADLGNINHLVDRDASGAIDAAFLEKGLVDLLNKRRRDYIFL